LSDTPVKSFQHALDPSAESGISLKVDISALHIRANQLHAEPMANVQAFKTALQSSFNRRLQKTDPRAFVRCAGDDGIELLPDP
jgi:hypothetical protein